MTFYVYCIAAAIVSGSLQCLFALQSSIQVKQGIGIASLGAYYGAGIPGSYIIYPVLLRLIGKKYSLVLGDACSIGFGLALLLPVTSDSVIYIRAILGAFEPSFWCAAYSIASSYRPRDCDDTQDGKARNVKQFIAITGFSQAIFNLVPELVLRKSNFADNKEMDLNISIYCGARDCPSEYSNKEEHPIFRNLIPSKLSIYILVSVIAVLQTSAVVMHLFILPNDVPCDQDAAQPLLCSVNDNKNPTIFGKNISKLFAHLKGSMSTIGISFLSLDTLFTFSSHLHHGFNSGFVWSVFSRSFVSCPLGIATVGLCMFIVNFMSASVSTLVAKLGDKVSMRAITCAKLFFDLATCSFMVAWKPSNSTLYVPYLLAVLTGLCHGLSRTVSASIPVSYFDDVDTAYSMCAGFVAVGIVISQFLAVEACTVTLVVVLASSSLISTITLIVGDCR